MSATRPTRSMGRTGRRAVLAVALTLPLAAFFSIESLFAPDAETWERWTRNDPSATARIDHGEWERLLKTYIVRDDEGLNRFTYGRVSNADRRRLDAYIGGLTQIPISRHSRAEQRAYWINLYNALTIKVVLAYYPVDSIRDIDISEGLFADGPWERKLVSVENEPVSLNDIEHRILRPIWRDPRLHYAVNCASIGCPNLQITAFTSANADALLDAAAREYINHPRAAQVNDGKLIVSSIYVWFWQDFGDDDADIISHLRRYAGPALADALAGVDAISGHRYDWTLNDALDAAS